MNSQPLFLYIPVIRLILMSIISFSTYEFYWIYRNWRYLKVAAVIPSCLCLVPVQIYVNTVTKQKQADQRYYPWSIGHFVCLFFGLIVWYVILTGG
jgi:hypothetical protein